MCKSSMAYAFKYIFSVMQARAMHYRVSIYVRTALVSDYVGFCPSFPSLSVHRGIHRASRSFPPAPDVFRNFLKDNVKEIQINVGTTRVMQRDLQYSRENSGHVQHFRFARRTSLESEHLPMQIFSYGRSMRRDALSVFDNPYFAVK